MNISYKRALFLPALKRHGTVTQHGLAVALGYSDAAVSTTLSALAKVGYVTTTPSPEHKRKHPVTVARRGSELVSKGRRLPDSHFSGLLATADIDAQHYSELTVKQTLAGKMNPATTSRPGFPAIPKG